MNNDLISRSELKKEINELAIPIYEKMVLKAIDNAPTVNTVSIEKQYFIKGFKEGCEYGKKCYERPQGEWFVNPHSMVMKCMNCGHEETAKDVGVVDKDKHFCYWCGADMRKDGAK